MPLSHPKRWIALGAVVLLVGLVAFLGPHLLAHVIQARSVKIMEQAAGPHSHIAIGSVQLDLIAGDLSWKDLRIEQRIDNADTSWTYGRPVLIAGHVGRISVKGLSIWRLLVGKSVEMRSLTVMAPQLELITSDRKSHETGEEKERKNLVNAFRVDSFSLDSGSLVWRNVRHDRPSAITKQFTATAAGIHVVLPHRHVPFTFQFVSANVELESTDVALPPLYDLHIAQLRIAQPDSMLQLKDIALTSRLGPKDYGKAVKYETDLVTFHTDSIGLRGLDFAALLNERSLRAGEARISGTDLNDYRDKTLRNAPFKNKPLPARLLRSLPFTLCLDSLVVERLNVEYNEKDTVTTDFGQVDLTDINAVAHGICTLHPEQKPELHLVATARVYEKAAVHFDLRTAIFDSSDHFSVKARIGPLPFKVFNAMTNDLLLIRTTAGTIGGIDYNLEANSEKGSGRVDVEYANLKVRIAKRDGSRDKNVFKSFLVNQVIRSKNIRADGNFRHGDFTIRRLKDRQIFNYMWRGLREGMMETVLPQALKDTQAAMKTAKDVTKGK